MELVQSNSLSLRLAAKRYSIPKTTLARKLRTGLPAKESMIEKRGRKTVLLEEDEKKLASHLRALCLSRESVCDVAKEFCEANGIPLPWKSSKLNYDWFTGFCKRNALSLKNTERLEKCRRLNTSNPFLIYEFYDLYEAELDQLELREKPDQIFDLDECGVSNDPNRSKAVAGQEQKNLYRTDQGSGRDNTTVMGCVSAAGRCLPPLFIFKGMRMWSTWKGSEDIPGTFYAVNESGFINTNSFYDYLKHLSRIEKERPLMIVLDGHVSHLNYATIAFAQKERISIIKLPSHTTDIMQPLDRACFGPFKTHWNKKILEWQRLNQRVPTKSEFVDLVCSVWSLRLSSLNICSGFRSCGLYPPNRNKYPVDRFNPTKFQQYLEHRETSTTQQQHSESQPNSVTDKQSDNCSEPSLETNSSEQTVEGDENLSVEVETTPASTETTTATVTAETTTKQKMDFEDLLLKKIGSTPKPTAQRRLIPCNAAVITSEEFSDKIKSLAEKPKRASRAKGNASSVSGNTTNDSTQLPSTSRAAARPKPKCATRPSQKKNKTSTTSKESATPDQLDMIATAGEKSNSVDQVQEFNPRPVFQSRNLGASKRKPNNKENVPPAPKKRSKFNVPYKKK